MSAIYLDDKLREGCRQSLWLFGRIICNRDKLRREHLPWQELAKKQRGVFLMPRESFKTTLFIEAQITKAILDNPEIRILLICDTAEHAWERMRVVIKHLSNPEAEWYCPGIHIRLSMASPRSQGVLMIPQDKGKPHRAKEPTLTACGIMTPQTGGHYDLIVCDDIVNEEDRSSRAVRRQKEDWLPTVFDLLAKGGKLHFIGTRWFESDLYGIIMRDYAEHFEFYKQGIYNSDGSLWLAEQYEYRLKLLKQKPIHFAHQYLNEPCSGVDAIFDRSWFKPVENPDIIWTVIGLDLSYAERDVREACDTAAVVWGITRDNEPVILDAIIKRVPPVEFQSKYLLILWKEWHPIFIFCEDMGGQKSSLELVQINQLMFDDPDYEDVQNMCNIIVGTGGGTADKVVRARPMESYAMTKGIKYRKTPSVEEVLDQLYAFPIGDKKDAVDAAVHGFNGIRSEIYTDQEVKRGNYRLPRRQRITSIRRRI